eukprot:8035953-Pyramimonas_sp.AAC.1
MENTRHEQSQPTHDITRSSHRSRKCRTLRYLGRGLDELAAHVELRQFKAPTARWELLPLLPPTLISDA